MITRTKKHTKTKKINGITQIKQKYAEELSKVQQYMGNEFIYNMFLNYGFTVDGKFIALDSNINLYEGCFISLVFQAYLQHNPSIKSFNVCEIGLAYGTSSMIILNEIIKSGLSSQYTVLDPNQTRQWNSIGHKNIMNFKKSYDTKHLVDYKLIEGFSNIEMPHLTEQGYNIVFIDGSHATNIVMEDMVNADRLLVNNGIMILDDVRHKEVQMGVEWFARNYPQYKRIFIDDKILSKLKYHKMTKVYDPYGNKKSYNNPTTMFALLKDTNHDNNEMFLHQHVSLHLHDHDLPLKEKFITTAKKLLGNIEYEHIRKSTEQLVDINCIQPNITTTKVILCLNKVIQKIHDLDEYLLYDFKGAFLNTKRSPGVINKLKKVYQNLSVFCVLALIYMNHLINLDIIVTDYMPSDDKNKKLKGLINHIIFNDIIPDIYKHVLQLMDLIIYRKGYDQRLFFGYMVPRNPNNSRTKDYNWMYNNEFAEINTEKTYMKGKNPRINLLQDLSKLNEIVKQNKTRKKKIPVSKYSVTL
jgi:predicted O-methyltransferase YrrM